jgi:long-chain fatty acid transport protein
MRRFSVWLAVGGLAAFAGISAPLVAQGFSVNEHSACTQARGGTAVASPCPDGSALVYNPAGLASMEKGKTQITVGGTFIAPSGGFTDDATGLRSDLKDRVYPVPQIYLTHGISDRIAAGIGLYAPYGLTTDWPTKAQGRFASYKAVIRNLYLQPTVAVKLGEYFKLGAGFDLNFLHLQLRQRVDLSEQEVPASPIPGLTFANLGIPAGTDFADVDVSANATGVGYHVGAIFSLGEELSFGAQYLSRQKVDGIKGDATINQVLTGILLPAGNPLGLPAGTPLDGLLLPQFQPGGPLVDQGGTTGIRLPEQLTLGLSVKPVEKFTALFDWTYSNWKVWDNVILDFDLLPTVVLPQNFKKVYAYRFGGEYELSPATVLRAGFITHDAAAPDQTVTPTLPEAGRSEFTVGFGTRLGSQGHVDLAYQYLDQAERRGRSGGPGTPNNGLYSFKAHLFGATFSWTF